MSLKNGARLEQIELIGANHFAPTDNMLICPLEFTLDETMYNKKMSYWPKEWYYSLSKLNGYLAIDFLGRT